MGGSSGLHLRERPPFLAIGFLIVFLLGVLYFVTTHQLRNAEMHRLRLMAGFADRVETTVSDLVGRFGRIAREATRPPEATTDGRSDAADPEIERESRSRRVEIYLNQIPDLAYIGPEDLGNGAPDLLPATCEPANGSSPDTLLCLTPLGSDLYLTYRSGRPTVPLRTVRARLNLEGALGSSILGDSFDTVFVATEEGTVVVQHGEPELRLEDLELLLESRAGEGESEDSGGLLGRLGGDEAAPGLDRPPRSTRSRRVEIAGMEYQAFLQPVRLELPAVRGERSPKPPVWLVGGLVSRERLLSASFTSSPILLFVLMSIFPAGVLAWPFLKLWLMPRRQRLRRFDAAFLMLSSFVGCVVLSVLVLDLHWWFKLRRQVDEQLEGLAAHLETGFREEVADMVQQLEALGDRRETIGTTWPEDLEIQSIQEDVRPKLATLGFDLDHYPIFHSAFWMNACGEQTIKLPLREHSIRRAAVEDREYFRCALGAVEPFVFEVDGRSQAVPVCLQSVISNTGGADQAILALPPAGPTKKVLRDRCTPEVLGTSELRQARGGDADFGARETPSEFLAPAMATRLASLTQVVLPPGFRFAVVDGVSDGRATVLFHSDPRRILTEDLLKASDEHPVLRSMLETRRSGSLRLDYWGQPHRAHLRHIVGTPWSLITLRATKDLRMRNVELLYDLLNPFLLLSFVYLLLTIAVRFLPREVLRAFWPDPSCNFVYRRIVFFALLALAGGAMAAVLLPHLEPYGASILVGIAFGVPVLSVILCGVALRRAQKRAEERRREHEIAQARAWRGAREDDGNEDDADLVSASDEAPGEAADEGSSGFGEVVGRLGLNDRREAGLAGLALLATVVSVVWVVAGRTPQAVLPAGSALVSMVLWVRFKHSFQGRQRRRSYEMAFGSLLLLLTVLPATLLFSVAESRQRLLVAQSVQEGLAAALEARKEATLESPLHDWEAFETYGARLRRWWAGQLGRFFGTRELAGQTWPESKTGSETWPWGGWLSHLFSARLIPVNDLSADPKGVDLSRFELDEPDRWTVEDGHVRGRIHADWGSGATAEAAVEQEPLLLCSTLPAGGWGPIEVVPVVLLLLLAGVTLGIPWVVTRSLSSKLLLIRLPEVTSLESEALATAERGGSGSGPDSDGGGDSGGDGGAASENELRYRDRIQIGQLLDPTRLRPSAGQHQRVLLVFSNPEQVLRSIEPRHREELERVAIDELPDRLQELLWDPRPMLVIRFNPRLDGEAEGWRQVTAFEELLLANDRAVVVVAEADPRTTLQTRGDDEVRDSPEEQLRRRWLALLGIFVLRYGIDPGRPEAFWSWLEVKRRAISSHLEKQGGGQGSWAERFRRKAREEEGWATLDWIRRECAGTRQLQVVGKQLLTEISPAAYETFTREKVTSKVGLLARPYYQAIWGATTEDEKVVLGQLATEGLVNPANRAVVLGLMYRGLIVRGPELQLMNDSFAEFIRGTVRPSRLLAWESEESTNLWTILRWLLPLPLLLLGGFLFITQPEAVSGIIGLVLAAASVLPTVSNLFSYFERRSAQTEATSPGKKRGKGDG